MFRDSTLSLLPFVLTVSLTISATFAAPVQDIVKAQKAQIYLSKFGYLPTAAENTIDIRIQDSDTLSDAISDFQRFAGVDITGVLDDETVEVMALPRCGIKDKFASGTNSRSKRYDIQGSRWRHKSLTYRITKYPRRLNRRKVDDEIKKAFSVWSYYTDLTFTAKRAYPVDIEIRFEYGGAAHFDDAEHWTVNSADGTNLLEVAAHEFGHSLGLKHSEFRTALMTPFTRGYSPVFQVHSDDIQGIQALYGRKTTGGGSGYESAQTPEQRSFCNLSENLCISD